MKSVTRRKPRGVCHVGDRRSARKSGGQDEAHGNVRGDSAYDTHCSSWYHCLQTTLLAPQHKRPTLLGKPITTRHKLLGRQHQSTLGFTKFPSYLNTRFTLRQKCDQLRLRILQSINTLFMCTTCCSRCTKNIKCVEIKAC